MDSFHRFPKNRIEAKDDGHQKISAGILDVISDPDFIKTFPGPSDMQYSVIKEEFLSSPHSAENSMHLLRSVIADTHKPLYAKLRLAKFLKTALGSIRQARLDGRVVSTIESGMQDLSQNSETPYFLAATLSPEVVLSPEHSLAGMERGLTPVKITENLYIQDNKYDPVPVFYEVSDPVRFDKIVQEQADRFAAARPENRPDIPRNASLKELAAYKKKYLDPQLNLDKELALLGEERKKSRDRYHCVKSWNTFRMPRIPMN